MFGESTARVIRYGKTQMNVWTLCGTRIKWKGGVFEIQGLIAGEECRCE